MSKLTLSLLAVVVLGMVTYLPARAAPTPLPNSMASTGDSITRAFDVNWLHLLSDSPQYSWSTGTNPRVNSQYLRILAHNPAIAGREFNDARTGANMADLDRQVLLAASQRVQYLTILMGANDLCTSSVSTMTPTATFEAEFQLALTDFFKADPTALIYVSSLPDLYHLWAILHTDPLAEATWSVFGICQSMLSLSNSELDRQKVVAQEAADNAVLAGTCARFPDCRWDDYAGYDFKFPASDISSVDYFHPNIHGQNDIATVTWQASYWSKL